MESSFRAVHEDARLGEVKHAYCTIDKSIKLLEYRTKYSLRDGLSKIAKWAKKDSAEEPTDILPSEILKGAPRDWNEKLL
jgi:nucleoside-diphosphate-sugar epimerase